MIKKYTKINFTKHFSQNIKFLFFIIGFIILFSTKTFAQGTTCTTATSLPCSTSNLAGTTVGTSNSAHGTGCTISNYGVWYKFVGDGNQTTISSTAETGFDHEMGITSGSCGTLTNISCNDAGFSGGTETYTFNTTNGINYYVYIAHYSTSGSTKGAFTISRSCTPPPVNNDCSGAIALTVNPTTTCTTSTNGTTIGATQSLAGCTGNADDDVWYQFTATSTTHIVTVATTTLNNAVFEVFNGTCGSLISISCINGTSGSSNETTTLNSLIPGNSYFVRVYSNGNITNQGTFSICLTTLPPCTSPTSQASSFTSGTITSTTFPATFSGSANGYLVIRSTSSTPPSQPVNGVIYSTGNISTLGTGLTFVQSSTSTTITSTGLNGNTRYYYYIYAYNNTNCTGGPSYNTSGALTGNGVTCPTTPSPVNTSAALTSASFSWPSSIGGGINAVSYQLQITTNAAYTTNVTGSPFTINDPTTIQNVTGLTANTTYYYRIRAFNGCYSTYTTGTVKTGYCTPAPTSVDGTGITNVTMGTINNTTGAEAGNYGNYTAQVTNGQQGETISFSITFSVSGWTYSTKMWIDWNNDLDFNDPDEEVFTGSTSGTITGSYLIPTNAVTGNHRIRIGGQYSGVPTPCYTGSYGTFEDYTLNVTTTTCPGPITIITNITSQTTVSFSWTAPASAPSNGYQYYLSTSATAPTSGTTPTGNIAAGVTAINLTALTPGTKYYVWIRSNCGGTKGFWIGPNTFTMPTCTIGNSTGTTALGCPSVISGGLGLNGADPAPFNCSSTSTCVDLEATYLKLGNTSTYTVESIAYAPPYQFSCLKNPVSVNIDDRWSPTINLPFDFCFYGNSYNACTIGSNGILSFNLANSGGASGYEFSNNLPSTTRALFSNSIYGVYHDIDPSVGGEVGWELITLNTGCRALIASWSDVPMYLNNSLLYTGMMVLYENTNVIEVYIKEKNIDGVWNDGNAIVGLQNAAGTAAVVAPGRNGLSADWTTTNEAWRFVPAGTSITSIAWHEGSGVSGPIVGTTDVINVCPSTTTTYTAEITYTLCNGSMLKETEETTVTLTGNKVWNGSINTNWDNDNNWTPIGKPTALDCVVIPTTANNPIISGTEYNGLGFNLTVENSATLTINSYNNLTITDWVNIIPGGNFNLDNSSSLIQINNVANSGTINFERSTSINRTDYVYWSSPVQDFASNLISTNTPLSAIYKWSPTTVTPYPVQFGNWINGNENMVKGKGYIVRGPSTFSTSSDAIFTSNFIGVPNNGDISIGITRGNTTTVGTYPGPTSTPVTQDDDNWNLIGNPYPSAISADDFITANTSKIDGFVYIWTHGTDPVSAVDPFYQDYVYNYTVNDYITYNHLGSAAPGFDGYIPSAQGFFVLMKDSAPTSDFLSFNNSMRSSIYRNDQFFRTNNTTEKNRIWLNLKRPDNANSSILVGYATNATNEIDNTFDAIANGIKSNFELYSIAEEKQLCIQGRGLPFNNNDKIQLGIAINQNGSHVISISKVDGLFSNTSQKIYLEDKEIGIIHDIKSNPYFFNSNVGRFENRFVLRYTDNTLGNSNFENFENDILILTSENLTIKSVQTDIESITIFDILGRNLITIKEINSSEKTIQNLMKNNVPLMIKIKLSNGVIINKKIIF